MTAVTTELLQFLVIGLTMGAVYGLVGMGYTIVYNATDTVNFAHGEFVMLGGMLAAVLVTTGDWSLLVAAVVAVAIVSALGAAVHALTLSRVGFDQIRIILMTLALGVVIRAVVLMVWGKDPLYLPEFGGLGDLDLRGVIISGQSLWVGIVAVVVMAALHLFYKHSRIGRGMVATSLDSYAASLMGVNVRFMTVLAFVLSAAIGAVAGIVATPLSATFYSVGVVMGLMGFVAAAIGGMGSALGTIVGGLILGITEAFVAGYVSSGFKVAAGLVAGLLILLVSPRGIFGGRLR